MMMITGADFVLLRFKSLCPQVQTWLKILELDLYEPQTLFRLLDADNDGGTIVLNCLQFAMGFETSRASKNRRSIKQTQAYCVINRF